MTPAPVDLSGSLDGVSYERRSDGIAVIKLSRTERGNSLAPHMQPIFRAICSEVRDAPAIRVAIIAAEGERHFCTGFDVAEAEGDDADEIFNDRPLAEAVHWSPHQNQVWKPVICAVQGLCVGGGLHFVVDSDVVVASRNVKFVATHVTVGMVGAREHTEKGVVVSIQLGRSARWMPPTYFRQCPAPSFRQSPDPNFLRPI